MLFTSQAGDPQLAWHVTAKKSSDEIYEYVLDADSGDVLLRQNTVDFAAGNVWEYAPQLNQVCPECSAASGAQALHAFPAGWGTQGGKLQGNYAHVYTDVDDNNVPDTPFGNCPECGEVAPNEAGPNWNYAFQANPNASHLSSNCFTIFPQCSWSVTTNAAFNFGYGWRPNLRQNATQVYFYVNNFHDWLASAPISFTAAAGNFEGADAVNAETLDGADSDHSPGSFPGTPDLNHLNNANMNTPADGTPPRMQMYLFADINGSATPESNGGDDASVIYHEYTHGLSNRLVLDSSGSPALRAFQSRAMGEGWSDWYAMDYLEGHDLDETDTADNGEMNMAVYVMGGDIHNLRTEGLDCNRGSGGDADCPGAGNAGSGGYTLGDMGKILLALPARVPRRRRDLGPDPLGPAPAVRGRPRRQHAQRHGRLPRPQPDHAGDGARAAGPELPRDAQRDPPGGRRPASRRPTRTGSGRSSPIGAWAISPATTAPTTPVRPRTSPSRRTATRSPAAR